MDWIKRNVTLIVGGLVALALLGGAGYYLYRQIERNSAATAELERKRDAWTGIYRRDAFPTNANIEVARRDVTRVQGFLASLHPHFTTISTQEMVTTTRELNTRFANTLAELTQQARQFGVTLPEEYRFTFEPEMGMTHSEEKNIPTLASQLTDIKAICQVLFKPRVHELSEIQRVAVTQEDKNAASLQFLDRSMETNQVAVLSPYKVTFKGFGGELARVLEGFAKAPECFVVKTVSVQGTTLTPPGQPARRRPGASPSETGGEGDWWGEYRSRMRGSEDERARERRREAEFRERYGTGAGGGGREEPGRSRTSSYFYQGFAGRRGGGTLPEELKEKPLEISLLVKVVKLKSEGR